MVKFSEFEALVKDINAFSAKAEAKAHIEKCEGMLKSLVADQQLSVAQTANFEAQIHSLQRRWSL